MDTHLMTLDLLAACDAEDVAAGQKPVDRSPEGTWMVPATLASEVTCPRCITWVRA